MLRVKSAQTNRLIAAQAAVFVDRAAPEHVKSTLTSPVSSQNKLLPRAWLTIGLLWLVGLLNYLDRVMITTMRGSLTEAIPMTDAQFGLLTAIFLWVYGVFSPFAGFMADRYSRSRVIVISLLSWSAITCRCASVAIYCSGVSAVK